jgi:hypothetical protein
MHPLYHHCKRLVNRPVTVHLVSGRSHYGVIQRVEPQGIYFRPMVAPVSAADEQIKPDVTTAEHRNADPEKVEPVFFAPFFFPFGLLAGLTLGLAAGAAFARPYPYYW